MTRSKPRQRVRRAAPSVPAPGAEPPATPDTGSEDTGGRSRRGSRWARRVAWSAFWTGLALRAAQLWLATHPATDRAVIAFGVGPVSIGASVIFGLSAAAVGGVIVTRVPGNRFGWLWVAVGVAQAVLATLLLVAADNAAVSATALLAGVIASVGVAVTPFVAMSLALLTFPTGAFLGRRWRLLAVAALAAATWRGAEAAFGADTLLLLPLVPNPLRADGIIGQAIRASDHLGVGVFLIVATVAMSMSAVVVRYRKADPIGRRQVLWFLLGAAGLVLTLVPTAYVFVVVGPLEQRSAPVFALSFLGFSLLPVTTLVAITRYRLYEIDRIVNRTVLYGALTAILAGVFTAGVALAQRIFIAVTHETSDAAVVGATLVVATLYAPLRKRLEGVVDRRFKFEQARFGAYREDLLRALTISRPERAAARLAREAVAELGLTGAAVLDRAGAAVATAGAWPAQPVVRVPIRHGGEILHSLVLGPRRDGERSDPREIADLESLAALVASAAGACPPEPAGTQRAGA